MKVLATGCLTLLEDIQISWILLLLWLFRRSYSFVLLWFFFLITVYVVVMFCALLFDFVCYVFLLLCRFCSVYSVFIVPTSTLRLPWLRFFGAFPSVVRQMPGYNSQRRGTGRTLPISLTTLVSNPRKSSMYCSCVNVYGTTATGCQPNCC